LTQRIKSKEEFYTKIQISRNVFKTDAFSFLNEEGEKISPVSRHFGSPKMIVAIAVAIATTPIQTNKSIQPKSVAKWQWQWMHCLLRTFRCMPPKSIE